MENLSKKQILIIGIMIVIIVVVVVYYFFNNLQQINYEYLDTNDMETIEENNIRLNTTEEIEETIIVHIAGAVEKEGIVTLKEDARIADAINEAGGLTEDADLTNVNLAYILSDGQKIYIPYIGEEKEINSENGENVILNGVEDSSNNNLLININTATITQLTELPRNRKFNSTKNNRL